ncbi:MAG: Holliday junction resolvase RuvX [Solirubrobacteraceae bacterium]
MRVLALDYGSARCGCAVSDPTGVLATPIEVVAVPRSRRGLARLSSLVAELGAQQVVVGLPLTLAGGESAQTRETREFAQALASRLTVPVELYDERFTTRLAERNGGRAEEDSRAAAYLLEGWLHAHADHDAGGSVGLDDDAGLDEGAGAGHDAHGSGENA